jgi:two-component system NtrC family response regulator
MQLRIEVTQTAIKKELQPSSSVEQKDFRNLPPLSEYRDTLYSQAESQYLRDLMAFTGNDIPEACRVSGLSQSRLYALLKKQKIQIQH